MIYYYLVFSLLLSSVYSQEDEEVTVEVNEGEGLESENYWKTSTVAAPESASSSTTSFTHPTLIPKNPLITNQNRSDNESEDRCKDTLPNCKERKKLCKMIPYGPLVTQFCAKTCGRCKEFSRLTRDQKCRDNDPRCATLVQLGFCFSNHNETTKVKYCARSCGLCDVVEV